MENKFKKCVENYLDSDNPYITASKFLLAFLALGGIVFAGAIVPSIISCSRKFGTSNKFGEDKIKNTLKSLKNRKFIQIIEDKNGTIKVQLTNKGRKRVKGFYFSDLKIKKPRKWDKKWRVLIFDIPSKSKQYNKIREALRGKIKDLGFYQLQKSVWIFPFECEDEILFISEMYGATKYIEFLTVNSLLHEEFLKVKFKLD